MRPMSVVVAVGWLIVIGLRLATHDYGTAFLVFCWGWIGYLNGRMDVERAR